MYPIFTAPLTTPLLRAPDAEVVFLVSVLCTVPADEPVVRRAIEANRSRYERARTVGGVAYHVGTIPRFTQRQWAEYFGPAWDPFTAAKQRHDPRHILCPGQGIFGAT